LRWSPQEARLFQLFAVGLHGKSYPPGEEGIRRCFRDLRGVQLDPLPVLGRNHDLVIQARVDGTHPGQFLDLVHRERIGFEYWDKVLCAIPIAEFPYTRALMAAGGDRWEQRREERLSREHPGAVEAVYEAVREHGPLSGAELRKLSVAQGTHRAWKATRAANGALEVLWNRGRLSVAYRVHYRRYFDLAERAIPKGLLSRPVPSLEDFREYLLLKRVEMVGLLPAGGDAEVWAFLRSARKEGLPERLVAEGKLSLVQVEGIRTPFYAPPDAGRRLAEAERLPLADRARFLAPLDPFLWGRGVLKKLWGFEYVWEVYKRPADRRWGYYVLPVLFRDRFVARFDGRFDAKSKTLHVLGYWEEPNGLPPGHPAIKEALWRFLRYVSGERIVFLGRESVELKRG